MSEQAKDTLQDFKQVEAPEIAEAGIADLMRTPADGVDRNSHINWDGARFAVRAMTIDGRPHHQVIVDYPSDKSATGRYTQGMAINLDNDGVPEAIATTSGGHREGMRHLSDEQREVVGQLIQRSITQV